MDKAQGLIINKIHVVQTDADDQSLHHNHVSSGLQNYDTQTVAIGITSQLLQNIRAVRRAKASTYFLELSDEGLAVTNPGLGRRNLQMKDPGQRTPGRRLPYPLLGTSE